MNWVTRFSLIALLCGTVLLPGDSIQTPKNPAYPAATSWRFDAPIQINPTTCVIKYKVSLLGANGERLKSFDFRIDLHEGTMSDGQTTKPINKSLGVHVHAHRALLNGLARYAVGGAEWFVQKKEKQVPASQPETKL